MSEEGIDLRQLALQLVAYLRTVLVSRVGGQQARAILVDLSDAQLAAVQGQARQVDAVALTAAVRLLNQASQEMREAAQPQLVLELAWLDAVARVAAPTGPVAAAAEHPLPSSVQPAQAAPWQSQPPVSTPPIIRQPAAVHAQPGGEAKAVQAQAPAPVPDQQVVDLLRAHWSSLLQSAEDARGAALRAALRTLRNVVAVGDDIYFAFEHDFAKQRVERPDDKKVVEDLIARLLGRPVHVHCQVGTQVTGVVAPVRGERTERAVADPPAAADDLAVDPVVRHAQQILGAVPSKL
jgi:DNA polymerase III gamma/tau subunit